MMCDTHAHSLMANLDIVRQRRRCRLLERVDLR